MGILDRIERPSLRADVNWHPLDERWYKAIEYASSTFSGFPIGPETALRVSAVFACTSLIAEILASLPCILYRRLDDGGKERARDHRLYRTLRRNPYGKRTPMDFFGTGQMNLGLRGRALAEIRDDGERRVEVLPISPDYVQIEETPSTRRRYTVTEPGKDRRTLSEEQVLDVQDLSLNGFDGLARAALAREAIAVAAAGEAYVGGFFKNDATGRLLINHPALLDDKKRAEYRKMIQENYAGWVNRSKAMILHGGVTATELGKHDDSGFIIDPRKFQVADVARFWRVPLFMIGLEEKSTTWGTGVEQIKQAFVDFSMKGWTDRWAQAMTLQLLDEDEQEEFFIEFLFQDLVRGDLLNRAKSYQIFRQIGVLAPNEIREKENMNRREDPAGDTYQETPTGAAPNPDRDERAVGGGGGGDTEEEARSVPVPLIADAAARIAGAELQPLERRAPKAQEDPEKWRAWVQAFYGEHKAYIGRVLSPIVEAFGLDPWVVAAVAVRLADTGITAVSQGVPDGWGERRKREVELVIHETFTAARGLSREGEEVAAA